MNWKVGELARQTGLTVRTLHHYDALGLLEPSGRSEAGHRMYTTRDVARLQQIRSLRALGFSLGEIAALLQRPDFAPREVVLQHAARLRGQIELQQRLCQRLERLAIALDRTAGKEPGAAELFAILEEMSRMEQYFTPEQAEKIRKRGEEVGAERIRAVEAEWPELMAEVQAAMDVGTDPADPAVQELARRWIGLVEEFTGGDPGIREGLNRMYQNETEVHGMNVAALRGMMDYIGQALAQRGR